MEHQYDQQHSVGNYKGVMLCNRPFDGGADRGNPEKPSCGNGSFICGTVKKPWGGNVVVEEKKRVLSRLSKKDSVLSKHRKWLSDLQKEKEQFDEKQFKDDAAKEEKKRKFMEREAKIRATMLDMNDEGEHDKASGQTAPVVEALHCKFKPERCQPFVDMGVLKKTDRPAWAMTESAAKDQSEVDGLLEEDELLSFVSGLDFETYEHDLELQMLMNQVKSRIAFLEKEKQKDEARLEVVFDSEEAAAKAEMNVTDDDYIFGDFNGKKAKEGEENDVISIAATVMSDDTSMGSIHSRKSTEALVTRSKAKIAALEPIAEAESKVTSPILVTHRDDEGARLAETKRLNKLPFKNRNPAL